MKKIYIVTGHNARKGGASGEYEGERYTEYDIATEWTHQIYNSLVDAYPTELIDDYSLTKKVEMINSGDPLFAVELHFNSNVNARGSESLYFPGSRKGKRLASLVQEEFNRVDIFQPDRGVKEGHYYNANGEKQGILYLLRRTKCPCILIEPEFMSNIDTIMKYKEEGMSCIENAIIEFYNEVLEDE